MKLEFLKSLYDQISNLESESTDRKLWLAQYNVLLNQLKSRNHRGTDDQLEVVVASLIEEAEIFLESEKQFKK